MVRTGWMADGISLDDICEDANWHLASAIRAARTAGFNDADAPAFVAFAFNEAAIHNGGTTDCESQSLLSDDQFRRLTSD